MISPPGTFLCMMMSVDPYLLPVMMTNLFIVVLTIPVHQPLCDPGDLPLRMHCSCVDRRFELEDGCPGPDDHGSWSSISPLPLFAMLNNCLYCQCIFNMKREMNKHPQGNTCGGELDWIGLDCLLHLCDYQQQVRQSPSLHLRVQILSVLQPSLLLVVFPHHLTQSHIEFEGCPFTLVARGRN